MEQSAALLLPQDVLADILARLAPRDLVMALVVCRAWRAVINSRRPLRADLLPLSLGGFFVNFNSHKFSEYFSDPSTTATISSMTGYVPHSTRYWRYVVGHCNGLLLLCDNCVVNPATRWWAEVPPASHTAPKTFYYRNYLVFDPTLSTHYEVFSIPHFYDDKDLGLTDQSEWPPSSCILHVFSSLTSRWEGTLFDRDGEAAATVLDMRKCMVEDSAVYYRRALYVHCQANVVLSISLSSNKYRAIKPPSPSIKEVFALGKSKNGVYFASLGSTWDRALRIWVLDESCGQTEWLLKYHVDLEYVYNEISHLLPSGSWVLQDVNYNYHRNHFSNEKNETQMDNGDRAEEHDYHGPVSIMGFHPFEEVIFLCQKMKRGLAYHLSSSKVQDLGHMYPRNYEYFAPVCEAILGYYPYTPCWM
ncbi:hypothetical protein EJB05_05380, partial [Eragrostis curvula]